MSTRIMLVSFGTLQISNTFSVRAKKKTVNRWFSSVATVSWPIIDKEEQSISFCPLATFRSLSDSSSYASKITRQLLNQLSILPLLFFLMCYSSSQLHLLLSISNKYFCVCFSTILSSFLCPNVLHFTSFLLFFFVAPL